MAHQHGGHSHHHVKHLFTCATQGRGPCRCEMHRYLLSASLAIAWAALQFIWSRIIGSAAAEGDSIHLFFDGAQSCVSAAIVLWAPHEHKLERQWRNNGALLQALFLFIAAVLIWWEASTHTVLPHSPREMLLLGAGSTAIAMWRFLVVHGTLSTITGKAEALHVAIDVATSVAVVIAGLFALYGLPDLDRPIAMYLIAPIAMINAGYIAFHTFSSRH